jgi:cytochrome c oxidase subunit 2
MLQSALDVHGSQAIGLLRLIWLFTGLCTAVWLAVIVMLAVAAMRCRAGSLAPEVQPEPDRERRLGIVVGAALALTVLIITGLTVASFLTSRTLNAATGDDALVLRVKGLQWWWEVAYTDSDPSRVFVSANEMHVPVGRPVRIELVGVDVIHSFWVPSLAGKQDMIPGRANEIAFTAQRPGTYRGQCAEFCGVQHAHMAFMVVAEEPEAFERWRAAQLAEAARPGDDLAREGERVFTARNCSACHTVRGTRAAGTLGPDLTHVASRQTIAAGMLPTTPGSLAAWIADPQTIKPGNNMPLVPLSAPELRAVTAYMASLR